MIKALKLSEVIPDVNAGDVLCSVEDIKDGMAKEFSFRYGNEIHDIFIQRKGSDIFAYANICPHAGTPLNMDEDRFLEKTGTYLMCHTHGALFQLSDGLCVAGPCNGEYLQAIDVNIENGNILVV